MTLPDAYIKVCDSGCKGQNLIHGDNRVSPAIHVTIDQLDICMRHVCDVHYREAESGYYKADQQDCGAAADREGQGDISPALSPVILLFSTEAL